MSYKFDKCECKVLLAVIYNISVIICMYCAGFTIVLRCVKAQGPVCQEDPSSCQFIFYDGILLIGCNSNFEGVLIRSDSRHNDRVDSLWECATKQAVMTVVYIETKLLGGLWLLAKTMFKMDSCLCGAILNLTAFCSIWTLIEGCSCMDT